MQNTPLNGQNRINQESELDTSRWKRARYTQPLLKEHLIYQD
jgi:hypothetical protein